jgi:Arc/MetJ-type ribon-helix-helix transcriptional regulator
MKKTTVYLPDDLKSALGRVALERRQSEAELIREAVRDLIRNSEAPRPRLPLFRSDDPTLAERVDEELRSFGE